MKVLNRNLLVVDDDEDILYLINTILKDTGFTNIHLATNKNQAIEIFESENIEMAILDILLPDGNGFEIIRHIRKTSNIPVLFLSAITDTEKQYNSFDLGADDYITKPFKPKDLILRTKAILNRTYPEAEVVFLEDSSIHFDKALIVKGNKEIRLTAKEYNILYLLYRNKNHIVTIDGILSSVWGNDYFGYENTLMAHIRKIRQKIEKDPSNPVNLLTFKGLGYKLKVK